MAQREPTAAQALYGHLPSCVPEPVKQRTQSLATAMYPRPSKDELVWQAICERNRQVLRRGLREAVANLRADKARRR
jgi:hypothetical protein